MPLIDTQDAVNAMYDLCENLDTENPHIDAIVDALEEIAPAQKRKFNDMSGGDFENWLRSHGICNPCIDDSIPCDILPLLIDDAIEETVPPVQPTIVRCYECKHNPLKEWFGCPMAHLNERQRPEDAWCWRGEREADG